MLGEQIAELKGKIMGQKVSDPEGPTMKTSISFIGSIKGTPVKQELSFISLTRYLTLCVVQFGGNLEKSINEINEQKET